MAGSRRASGPQRGKTPKAGRAGGGGRSAPRWLVPVLAALAMTPLLVLSVGFGIVMGTYASSPVVQATSGALRAGYLTLFIGPFVCAALSIVAWGLVLFRRTVRWQTVFGAVAVLLAGATPVSWFPLGFV